MSTYNFNGAFRAILPLRRVCITSRDIFQIPLGCYIKAFQSLAAVILNYDVRARNRVKSFFHLYVKIKQIFCMPPRAFNCVD